MCRILGTKDYRVLRDITTDLDTWISLSYLARKTIFVKQDNLSSSKLIAA